MPGPEVTLRTASAADIDAVTALLMQTYLATWAPELRPEAAAAHGSGERTRAYVEAHWPEFTVATVDGAVAGMVHVAGDFIDALHVSPARQRSGLGATLLSHAEAQMRANGQTLARLETDTFNTQSRAFYGKHGYAEVATYPDEEWDSGFTTVLLTKAL